MVELIVTLTVFTYGTNIFLYYLLKQKKKMPGLEKLSIFFGINMSILLFDGMFLLIGKIVLDSGLNLLD